MKRFVVILLLPLVIFACGNKNKKTHFSSDSSTNTEPRKLVLMAQTPKDLKTPESVCFDKTRNRFYVSNINGKPMAKDNNGFISILTKSGDIEKLKWVEGLDAPKGMGIYRGYLYVTDIDRVVKIDIDREKIVKTYSFPKAKFLNDIAIDDNGNVYISDMLNNLVYKLTRNGEISVFADSMDKANGMLIRENILYVGCHPSLYAINLENGIKRDVIDVSDMDMIDGLKFADSGFIVSDWVGHVYFLDTLQRKQVLLLNTADKKVNAADFEYVEKDNLLLIPTFYDGRVDFYKFVK